MKQNFQPKQYYNLKKKEGNKFPSQARKKKQQRRKTIESKDTGEGGKLLMDAIKTL